MLDAQTFPLKGITLLLKEGFFPIPMIAYILPVCSNYSKRCKKMMASRKAKNSKQMKRLLAHEDRYRVWEVLGYLYSADPKLVDHAIEVCLK